MNTRKAFLTFFTLVMTLGVMLPMAKADAAEEVTKLTFSQAVAIPGQTLPAGTYLFVVDDDTHTVVRIFSADRSKIYATLNTVPSIRGKETGKIAVNFAERSSGQPDAILSWYNPGMVDGHEFTYSSGEERELASDPKLAVKAAPENSTGSKVVSGN